MEEIDLQSLVLSICKKLPELGLVSGTEGNVSARDPETGFVGIKPSSFPYDQMEADDIIIMTVSGEIITNKNDRKPSFETSTHLEIYRRFPDVNGVIHSHSKFVNILSSVRNEIPCATTPTGLHLLKKPVPVIEFVDYGTQEMAERVAHSLDRSVAVAIRNHGPFIIGENLELALQRTVALEDTSQIYFMASLLGTPSLIPDN